MLVIGAGVAIVWPMFTAGSLSTNARFTLGVVGMVVGIGTSVWVSRRFDEAEERWKAERRKGEP